MIYSEEDFSLFFINNQWYIILLNTILKLFGKIIISHDKINTTQFYLGSFYKRVINTS